MSVEESDLLVFFKEIEKQELDTEQKIKLDGCRDKPLHG